MINEVPATPPLGRSPLRASATRVTVLLGIVVYAAAFALAARQWELPSIGLESVALLTAALGAEIAAKLLFAVLFRDALQRQDTSVSWPAAIQAAFVGTTVSRLIPAGGALTPTAMAWSVRGEDDQAAGAALRATVASYGGLLLLTGLTLGWGAFTGRHPLLFTGAVVAGVLLIGVGGLILSGSRWLGDLVLRLPERLRRHLGPTAGGGNPTLREVAVVGMRVALEGAVLWSALHAFGIQVTPSEAMVAFGISTVIGGIPATPGGIGLVEGGLVGVLAGFGFSPSTVIAPILVYRIIDYWIAAAPGIIAAGRVARTNEPPIGTRLP